MSTGNRGGVEEVGNDEESAWGDLTAGGVKLGGRRGVWKSWKVRIIRRRKESPTVTPLHLINPFT